VSFCDPLSLSGLTYSGSLTSRTGGLTASNLPSIEAAAVLKGSYVYSSPTSGHDHKEPILKNVQSYSDVAIVKDGWVLSNHTQKGQGIGCSLYPAQALTKQAACNQQRH
jgi:hypothetical protein